MDNNLLMMDPFARLALRGEAEDMAKSLSLKLAVRKMIQKRYQIETKLLEKNLLKITMKRMEKLVHAITEVENHLERLILE